MCRHHGQAILTPTKYFEDLGHQSQISESCQSSHETVSSEPFQGLGLVFRSFELAVRRRVRGSLATMDQGLAAAGQEAGLAVELIQG